MTDTTPRTVAAPTPALFADIAAVWPAGADHQWLGELADALADQYPGEYPATARDLAAELANHGVQLRDFYRRVDGLHVSRQGVSKAALAVSWAVAVAEATPVGGTCEDVITADRHRLDAILEAALDDWQGSPVDQRTEGGVVRDVLTDPAHRLVVLSWLTEVGLIGGQS